MKRIRVLKTNTQIEPAYMGLKDLAAWSGIGVTRLRQAIKEEGLPCFRYGGTFLVSLDEFNRWMEGHRYTPSLDQIVSEAMEGLE